MKVTEVLYDNRTKETMEVSWGNKIDSDLSVIRSVVAIIDQQRSREDGTNNSPFAERLTTLSIRIEL